MRHTLSKQMALSQANLPEGTRDKLEAMVLKKNGPQPLIAGRTAQLSVKCGPHFRFQSSGEAADKQKGRGTPRRS